jgi:hypothetical protein
MMDVRYVAMSVYDVGQDVLSLVWVYDCEVCLC